MSKPSAPPDFSYAPPPLAPPSYAQAVGGVPPTSPYTPQYTIRNGPEIVTTVVPLGPRQTHMICPFCRAEVDTKTTTKPGPLAYISGLIIAIFCCICGCCLIPCCMESCMITQHKCPNCDGYLGTYRR